MDWYSIDQARKRGFVFGFIIGVVVYGILALLFISAN